MVYRKRYVLKRPKYGRTRYRSRKYSGSRAAVVRRIRRVERKVGSVEAKFLDKNCASPTVGAINTWYPYAYGVSPGTEYINSMAANAGNSGRVGRKITLKSIEAKIRIVPTYQATIGDRASEVRLLLVKDRFPNGSNFATTIVASPTTVMRNVSTTTLTDMPVVENKRRFKIVRDFKVRFPIDGGAVVLDYYKRFKKGEQILFGSAGTAVFADHLTNAYFWMVCSDTVAATPAALECATRVRYTDV